MATSNCFVTHIIQKHLLCSTEERNEYRFATTWGWVNDNNIFIFGRTIPLNSSWFTKTKSVARNSIVWVAGLSAFHLLNSGTNFLKTFVLSLHSRPLKLISKLTYLQYVLLIDCLSHFSVPCLLSLLVWMTSVCFICLIMWMYNCICVHVIYQRYVKRSLVF